MNLHESHHLQTIVRNVAAETVRYPPINTVSWLSLGENSVQVIYVQITVAMPTFRGGK